MNSGESSPPFDARREVERYNASSGDYLNRDEWYGVVYDCPKCLNRGNFMALREDGSRYFYDCDCLEKRKTFRHIRRSGLSELLTRYTLDTWQCREPWQKKLMDMALKYAEAPEGWFCLSGTPGTGKTHICTALCGRLIERGFPVRYMLWRDVSTKAKAVVNDAEAYREIVEPLKRVRVLYIDDLFKTGKAVNRATGQRAPMSPTGGDIHLAFEILNARYLDSRLLTIISTEMTLGQITSFDEATGGRIVERTRGRYQDLSAPKYQDWRLSYD